MVLSWDLMTPKREREWRKTARQKLGIPVEPGGLAEAALTHPSFRNENVCLKLENFDRLEFFGDAVLNYVVVQGLFRAFPAADEGTLSRLRSTLVSRKILARIAREIKLGSILRLARGITKLPASAKDKILADSLEAAIAAVFFAGSPEKAHRFIMHHFRAYLDARRLSRLDPNPKSTLQELCQKHWQKLPTYHSTVTSQGIRTAVGINTRLKTVAYGKNRKSSEEKAARMLVRRLRQWSVERSKKASAGRKLRKAG